MTRSWESVFVLLLSDLLLFTQRLTPEISSSSSSSLTAVEAASSSASSSAIISGSATRLKVVEAPLFLSEVLASDFGTEEATDFSIAVFMPNGVVDNKAESEEATAAAEGSFHCVPICLRAPSPSKKQIWKAHLKHRLDILHEASVECVVDDGDDYQKGAEDDQDDVVKKVQNSPEEENNTVETPLINAQSSLV